MPYAYTFSDPRLSGPPNKPPDRALFRTRGFKSGTQLHPRWPITKKNGWQICQPFVFALTYVCDLVSAAVRTAVSTTVGTAPAVRSTTVEAPSTA